MVTLSSSGGLCGCGTVCQTPKELISADLPAISFTIVRVPSGSIALHLLPLKAPFSLDGQNGKWIHNIQITFTLHAKYHPNHQSSLHFHSFSKSSHQELTNNWTTGNANPTAWWCGLGNNIIGVPKYSFKSLWVTVSPLSWSPLANEFELNNVRNCN